MSPIDAPTAERNLDCEAHRIALSSALDGEVDSLSIGESIGHLAHCQPCRRFVAQARRLEAAVLHEEATGAHPERPVAAAVWRRIEAQAWPPASARARSTRRWAWGAAAAALLALAGAGLWNSIGRGVSQEVMTQEGAPASEFRLRGALADREASQAAAETGRPSGGSSR